MKHKSFVSVMILGLSLLVLMGCASTTPPSRFYTLNSISSPEPQQGQSLTQGRTIGLGPIRFPDYLDRPGIVTRTGNNTLEIAEFDLWAGSLKEDFTRVLLQNLFILLETDKIILYPYSSTLPTNLRVLLSVTRFDGNLGDKVFLDAGWIILEGPDKKEGVSQMSRIVEPVNGPDYEALTAAQSRAVERLSREIAKALKANPASPAAK
jgi:uncharacterized lipoprotein YmbA